MPITEAGQRIETQRRRRGHRFFPSASEAAQLPAMYDTEDTAAAEKVLHLHYFVGGCDWWIAEYDQETGDGYGYACLGDPQGAEWGYTSLVELEALRVQRGLYVVERDLYWEPKPAREANLPGWRAAL